jgi:hypothetical protein
MNPEEVTGKEDPIRVVLRSTPSSRSPNALRGRALPLRQAAAQEHDPSRVVDPRAVDHRIEVARPSLVI